MRRRQLGQNVGGTTYKDGTDPRVVKILEDARNGPANWRADGIERGERICIRYGDPVTGRDWGDRDMCGTIERSAGQQKIPLMVSSKRSFPQGIFDDKIVRITRAAKSKQKHGLKYVLYEHPKYFHPAGDIEAFERIAKDADSEARSARKAGNKKKADELKTKAREIRLLRYKLEPFGRSR